MTPSVITGIDEVLNERKSERWAEIFTYDRKKAKATGVVTLAWAATGSPIPLNVEISEDALEKGFINWRELHRKIKHCLPDNILKQRISEVNSVMRDANRRHFKNVERDFKVWLESTANDIEKMFGQEARDTFMVEGPKPSNLKEGSIQALHAQVNEKIDRLKNF